MAWKAATRIKFGDDKESAEYKERGDTVTKSEFPDDWDDLVAAKAVVESDEFDRLFPEGSGRLNQAAGTPSNLEQVEGTTLQAESQKEGPDMTEAEAGVNPADPPKVKDAGTASGFDTKGAPGNAGGQS